jgi:hypothetical protein
VRRSVARLDGGTRQHEHPATDFSPTASTNPVLVAARWLTLCNALNYNVGNFVKFVTNLLPAGDLWHSASEALVLGAGPVCDDCRAING